MDHAMGLKLILDEGRCGFCVGGKDRVRVRIARVGVEHVLRTGEEVEEPAWVDSIEHRIVKMFES